jgi:hypothetical protein
MNRFKLASLYSSLLSLFLAGSVAEAAYVGRRLFHRVAPFPQLGRAPYRGVLPRCPQAATVNAFTRFYGVHLHEYPAIPSSPTTCPMNRQAVKKVSFEDAGNDAAFWRSRSPQERLHTLTSIRREYHDWPEEPAEDDHRPRLQRVCRVFKRT